MPVHPRPCGEHLIRCNVHTLKFGSSPPVRGTPTRARSMRWLLRFIPARAGNTCSDARPDTSVPASTVHPRPCGEHARLQTLGRSVRRFIPARAGNTRNGPTNRGQSDTRFIPARAGNTASPTMRMLRADSWTRVHRVRMPVHPRPCGEHGQQAQVPGQTGARAAAGVLEDQSGSSPPVRGTLQR